MFSSAVLLVGGSDFTCPAILAAHELQMQALIVDRNPNAPAMILADQRVLASTHDSEAILRTLSQMPTNGVAKIAGVMTVGHDVEVVVAELATKLKLPSISVESAMSCHLKDVTRDKLSSAKVSMVPYQASKHLHSIEKFVADIGLPVITKSNSNCASRGATIVNGAKDIPAAFAKAQASSSDGLVLVESLLVGSEHSVEILFDAAGNCHHINIVDRLFTIQHGVPMEYAHVSPSKMPATKQRRIYQLAEQAAAAVGVQWGVLKCDVIWTKDGPVVLEATARLSGGFDSSHTFGMATGRNSIRAAMRVACGLPFDSADLTPRWQKFAACWSPLSGDEQSCADRKEFWLTTGNTYEEALRKAKAMADCEVIKR